MKFKPYLILSYLILSLFNLKLFSDEISNLQKKMEIYVSSIEVSIEGIGQVFGPSDFNKNVFQLKKQIHLTVGEYQISTILRSKPESYLTIVISNKDISSFPELP